jgi:hypothetical protein
MRSSKAAPNGVGLLTRDNMPNLSKTPSVAARASGPVGARIRL